ncbi:MAG: hypothetical protein OWU84_06895 [Firmicutes bacterium]|nr:hypothetical protein [Bacillota bacterium]
MRRWQTACLGFASVLLFTGCSVSLGSPSPEHGSTTSSEHRSDSDPGHDQGQPSLAVQKAVQEALETPKMQRMIAETVSSQQLQQALMTPQGQAILERLVTLVMSSPSVKQQVSQDVMAALQSGQVTPLIDQAVRTSLLSLASQSSGNASQKSGSSSSSSSTTAGGQGSGSSSSGSGKST